MEETKHTPGPWIPWETPMIHQGRYYQCPIESGHKDGIINVAMAYGVTIEEAKANADLIRLAPELLEQVAALTKWKGEALIVLNRWSLVSDFLSEHNLVRLGDDYSVKCLEVLKALTKENEELHKSTHLLHEAMVSAEKRGHDKATEALTEQVEELKAENGSFVGLISTLESELSRLREEVNKLKEGQRHEDGDL